MPDPEDYWGSGQDPYTDKETGVLKNIPGLATQAALEKFESTMFQANFPEAVDYACSLKRFSLGAWQEIHKICFSDVYEWAGQLRTIRIAKGQTVFAFPENIESEADNQFRLLNDDLDTGKLDFEKTVMYFAEMNVLHPFREGNGRTQRILFTGIFSRIGYKVDYAKTSQSAMIEAVIDAYNGDYQKVMDLFTAISGKQ